MNEKRNLLKQAEDISLNRVSLAKEFQGKGEKIIGYPCALVPVELITAAGLIPHRIYADMSEVITEADRALPAAFCPIMRSCLDCALKARNDFLDGIAAVHSCDPQEKTLRVWESYAPSRYFHFLDLPATVRPEVMDYFKGQLEDFRKTLESFAGREISGEGLARAIDSHNQQRTRVQKLYEMTQEDPPPISGAEILEVTKALLSLPADEGNELLRRIIAEIRTNPSRRKEKKARLLLWTSTLDDLKLMRMIEDRAWVVIDDNCAGLRPFHSQVKQTQDPLDGLAQYYLKEISCARTFRESQPGGTRKLKEQDQQSRFGFLKDRARQWKVQGALLFLVRYCDPFAFEMMELKDYFDALGIPATYIEYDYSRGGLGPLRTRVEAFLETLE